MPEPNSADLRHSRRRPQLGLIALSVCVTLGLLLAACPLSVVAIQQRVIAPPRFAVRVGNIEIAAPCPPRPDLRRPAALVRGLVGR